MPREIPCKIKSIYPEEQSITIENYTDIRVVYKETFFYTEGFFSTRNLVYSIIFDNKFVKITVSGRVLTDICEFER